jgi:hypothetical protein
MPFFFSITGPGNLRVSLSVGVCPGQMKGVGEEIGIVVIRYEKPPVLDDAIDVF